MRLTVHRKEGVAGMEGGWGGCSLQFLQAGSSCGGLLASCSCLPLQVLSTLVQGQDVGFKGLNLPNIPLLATLKLTQSVGILSLLVLKSSLGPATTSAFKFSCKPISPVWTEGCFELS